jgi:hypothetical protein
VRIVDKAAVEDLKQVTTEEIVKRATTGDNNAPANQIVAARELPSGDMLLHTNTPQKKKSVSSIKLSGSKGSTPQRKSKEEPIESSSTVWEWRTSRITPASRPRKAFKKDYIRA